MTYPSYPGYPPPKKSAWSSPAVLVSMVAGLVVLIAGISIALMVKNKSDKNDAAPLTTTSTTTTTIDSGPHSGEPTTVTVPPTTTTTTSSGSHPDVTVSGADWQGFLSGPRCNASDDPAVFIGQTNRSQVVVCQVGSQTGRYYYKGYADGKSIEVGYPTRSGSQFTATNGSTQYIVNPSSLTITDNGTQLTSEPMVQSWVN
ncbi:MAG: hypothetical protein QM658_07545 [Gordonia sp. (in: high G+C Gram-positive bacteria)]